MPIKQKFTITLNNQPYVDDFSEGKTCEAVYDGHRYVKVEYDTVSGLIKQVVAEADTLPDVNQWNPIPEPQHDFLVIDGTLNTFEAAYLTSSYTYDTVPTYEENLGTVDDQGNPEFWKYEFSTEGSILGHIYKSQSLSYINGEFIKPPVRGHMVTRANWLIQIETHKKMCAEELARNNVYDDQEIEQIRQYQTWINNVLDKYGDTLHWKIKFPNCPAFKP